jgi:hypothetical protein
MIGALGGKTRCSLPVKATIAKQLAQIISGKADFKLRTAIRDAFVDEFAQAKSS